MTQNELYKVLEKQLDIIREAVNAYITDNNIKIIDPTSIISIAVDTNDKYQNAFLLDYTGCEDEENVYVFNYVRLNEEK